MELSFFDSVCFEFHTLLKNAGIARGDLIHSDELLERGRMLIMSRLRDGALKDALKNDAQTYYYNIAVCAFCGGIAFGDAWNKDPVSVKTGAVDALLAAQPDLFSLACGILGLDGDGESSLRRLIDALFSAFLDKMAPLWDGDNTRGYLFSGLLAFFETGLSLKL